MAIPFELGRCGTQCAEPNPKPLGVLEWWCLCHWAQTEPVQPSLATNSWTILAQGLRNWLCGSKLTYIIHYSMFLTCSHDYCRYTSCHSENSDPAPPTTICLGAGAMGSLGGEAVPWQQQVLSPNHPKHGATDPIWQHQVSSTLLSVLMLKNGDHTWQIHALEQWLFWEVNWDNTIAYH